MSIWDPACDIYIRGDQVPCLCAQLQAWLHCGRWLLVGTEAVKPARVRDGQSQRRLHESGTPLPYSVWMCMCVLGLGVYLCADVALRARNMQRARLTRKMFPRDPG